MTEAASNLDKKICHCGTAREVVDHAIKEAIALMNNDDCIVFDLAKLHMTIIMLMSLWASARGNQPGNNQMETTAEAHDVNETVRLMCNAIIEEEGGIITKMAEEMVRQRALN